MKKLLLIVIFLLQSQLVFSLKFDEGPRSHVLVSAITQSGKIEFTYFSKGELRSVSFYNRDGRILYDHFIDGYLTQTIYYSPDGKLRKSILYYKSGAPRYVLEVDMAGKRSQVEFDQSGNKVFHEMKLECRK